MRIFLISCFFHPKNGRKKCKSWESKSFSLIEHRLQKKESRFDRDINVLTKSSLNSFSFSSLQMKYPFLSLMGQP